MLERRERLKLEDGRELRLLSALEVLEARREAEGLARGEAEAALCANACLLARALERDGKPGEDGKRATDFIDCVAWRGTAEFLCKFFGKGRMVVATGRLQTRTWKDKHDQTRKETELNATNLYFGDTKKLEQVADIYQQGGNTYDEITEDDGELPF